MANTNAPFGLRPVGHIAGGDVRLQEYSIASAYNTNIFQGDVVELTGTGTNVALAAAENVDNLGVFWGCRYVDSSGNQVFKNYWPADTVGTNIVALVYDDPMTMFECQTDTLAAADVGTLVDWNAGTGSTTTGVSGLYAVGSVTGTSGKGLRVKKLVPRPDNAYGAYAKAHVVFAEHIHLTGAAGAGGV
jgi:hypothetical protein